MTKDRSQLLKGIAILFMIFFHLFNRMRFVELCHPFVFLGDQPLVHVLTKSMNPVAFFLILSGYGIYKSWRKNNDQNRWGRLLKLLIHFWMILLVFVAIGHHIKPDRYPGDLFTFILNFSTLIKTYNGELWFLFPYICVSILAPYIFKITQNLKWYWIVVGALLIYIGTLFMMTRVIIHFPDIEKGLYVLLCIPLFLFNFSLGMLCASHNIYERMSKWTSDAWGGIICWLLVVCVFVSSFFIPYNFFYAFFLISLLAVAPFPKFISVTLVKLGNQSMNMWMIHSWFCYHLFTNFIYSFEYPILIFFVLVVISYALSKIFNILCMPLEQWLLTKKEIKEKPIL